LVRIRRFPILLLIACAVGVLGFSDMAIPGHGASVGLSFSWDGDADTVQEGALLAQATPALQDPAATDTESTDETENEETQSDENQSNESQTQDTTTTGTAIDLRFPFPDPDQFDLSPPPGGSLILPEPSNITTEITFDPETGNYIKTRKLGNRVIGDPVYISFEDYFQYDMDRACKTTGARKQHHRLLNDVTD
jgi:hypothetical protein